jgi:hypothetical protein
LFYAHAIAEETRAHDAPGQETEYAMNSRTHAALLTDIPLLKPGARIAADSCSLIFLNRLRLLESYTDVHAVLLTQTIYDEITRMPRSTDTAEDTELYEKLRTSGKIDVRAADAHPAPAHASLSSADRTLIRAFTTLKPDGMLTDDRALCRYCRAHTIPYINTPIALFILLCNGAITHDQYTDRLHALYSMGRYGHFVRDHMNKVYNQYCSRIDT